MRIRNREEENMEVQMGPLIDCVFLLLIFFIVIAVTKKSIKELGIQLPPPGAAVAEVKPKDKDLVLRVTKDGEVWVGDQQVEKQGLLDAIRNTAAEGTDSKVRLEIDQRVAFSHVAPIFDQLTHYGLKNWGFRTTMQE